ncbi:uncharacterized protein LOC123678671 [Harmonia axyridis]|uniref:uncharacterized protein LOC123678671 n=1 Tax=Harmonia axyridis TaxID=115357 RepID=UPI001E2763EA|nr:uncharacterized protein LOC123678671 [Harmonia axyridis]
MLGEFEEMFNEMMNKISLQANDTFSKISFTQQPINEVPTYSNIVKSKSMVVIKPKDAEQTNSKTKLDIMRNIDPIDLKLGVSQVKQIKDGGILIGCDNPEGAKNFKKIANEKLSTDYKISDVRKFLPKIRIVGLVENYSSDDILKFLRGQNSVLSDVTHLRVLKTWATRKNPNVFQALIELDAGAYGLVMDLGKLFVNFDACSVFDATDVRICFRCSGFNHIQSNCSLKITCPKCTGEHPLNKCTSSTLKCINCNNANLADTSHAVWDAAKCPIYKKKLNNLKSSIFVTK